jgi:ankyrin repeat protein
MLSSNPVRALFVAAILAPSLWCQSQPQVRQALGRALPLLQHSASTFVGKRACVSCHHNILPILALPMARVRGFMIDTAVLDAVEEKTFRDLRSPASLDEAIQGIHVNDPTPNDSFLLMAAHAARLEPSLVTAVYARRLAAWQRDGHWVTSDFRPPHSSSIFTATATAVRAIRLYMPVELRAQADGCIRRARQWLVSSTPASTEDAAFRLLGLAWAGAPASEREVARRDLLARQSPAGGWAQLPRSKPDAYATGEALFALHESAMPADAPAFRRGAKFLLSTQAVDGSWHVRTRMLSPAHVSPPYFTTGFPYAKDEYLSYAGSCWAVMALLASLPETVSPAVATAAHPAPEPPSWIRTALFGTADELARLLDAGLDSNARTPQGTTLLMMAAPDVDKVRLLLARGAPPNLEALTIAAGYRGTARSLEALLDAGAPVQPPPGARSSQSPLSMASMTGDLENVKLLLARGADAKSAASALASAVTFGYADVVRALIRAGAPAGIRESSGINLLHWAAIANRPEVIPVLVEAGVPLDDTDDSGYTPLMYAATIDFGNDQTLQLLRKAGADPNIRNPDGRTATQQARRYLRTIPR